MKIPIIVVSILLIVFYLVVPILIWIFARKSRLGKIIVIISTILFGIVLFVGITSRVLIINGDVIVDIDYSYNWCDKVVNFSLFNINSFDFIINILMLIPIGLVVAYFNKKRLILKILQSAIVGLVIGIILESMQFVLPVYRSVQLSDVLLNCISVVLGCYLGIIYDKLFLKSRNR